MQNPILFSEKQRFTQWWLWLLLLSINAWMFYGLFQQLVLKIPFGDKEASNLGLIIITLIGMLFTFAFYCLRLETKISSDSISVRFFPFHLKFKVFPLEEISKVYVREYKPIREYGGWGIKYGFRGQGKVYNVSGNKGLQMEFKNGEKLLIGTQKAEELELVLKEIL